MANIKTLIDLSEHATFARLNDLIKIMDSQDEAMRRLPMTRSPHHTVAFLVIYELIAQKDRQTFIDNLNRIVSREKFKLLFTKEELDNLSRDIGAHWPSLLEDINNRIGKADDFLQVRVSRDVYDASAEDGFVKTIQNNKIICPDEELTNTELRIDTTVYAKKTWKEPFGENNGVWFVEENVSRVPTGVFESNGLPDKHGAFFIRKGEDELIKLKNSLSKTAIGTSCEQSFGAFHIKVTKLKQVFWDNIKDEFVLRIPHGKAKALQAEFKETKVGAGIYQALLGTNLHGATALVTVVNVLLKGKAKFDSIGMEVEQTQAIKGASGGAGGNNERAREYYRFEITVNKLYVYEPNTGIHINFSANQQRAGGGAAAGEHQYAQQENVHDHFIEIQLNTETYYDERAEYQGKTHVVLLPNFSNRSVLNTSDVTTHPSPTFRGLSAESKNLTTSLDPADKPRNAGSVERPDQLPSDSGVLPNFSRNALEKRSRVMQAGLAITGIILCIGGIVGCAVNPIWGITLALSIVAILVGLLAVALSASLKKESQLLNGGNKPQEDTAQPGAVFSC